MSIFHERPLFCSPVTIPYDPDKIALYRKNLSNLILLAMYGIVRIPTEHQVSQKNKINNCLIVYHYTGKNAITNGKLRGEATKRGGDRFGLTRETL